MEKLDKIGEDLFSKIRGKFENVVIGDENGDITTEPTMTRFIDFNFLNKKSPEGKVTISIEGNELNKKKKLIVIYSKNFLSNSGNMVKRDWQDFLKELRIFARSRMMTFDVRNINKSNLNVRDYKFLAKNRSGDKEMNESTLYGTSRTSYQDVGNARLIVRHNKPINPELSTGRSKNLGAIYIESAEGEKFIYPYRHLNGARAMARHVSEGGKPYDEFGQHIVNLSEEMSNLRKFKNYVNRSAVMAEGLSKYTDIVQERIVNIRKTIERLQNPKFYKETFEAFEQPVFEDVPEDVKENWIDELTIRQFNEELKDVFPYVYNLVKENTKAKELGPDEFFDEEFDVDEGEQHGNSKIYKKCWNGYERVPGTKRGEEGSCRKKDNNSIDFESEYELALDEVLGQFSENSSQKDQNNDGKNDFTDVQIGGMSPEEAVEKVTGEKPEEEVEEGKGLYANIHAKRKRGEKPNPPGHPDRPSDKDFEDAEKTAKENLSEFILSFFDRNSGQFPKGETAVLTKVEKDYGDQYVVPAKKFIEQVQQTYQTLMDQQNNNEEFEDIRRLAGLN